MASHCRSASLPLVAFWKNQTKEQFVALWWAETSTIDVHRAVRSYSQLMPLSIRFRLRRELSHLRAFLYTVLMQKICCSIRDLVHIDRSRIAGSAWSSFDRKILVFSKSLTANFADVALPYFENSYVDIPQLFEQATLNLSLMASSATSKSTSDFETFYEM